MATITATNESRVRVYGHRVASVAALLLVLSALPAILGYGIVGWLDTTTLERLYPGDAVHRVHGIAHSMVAWLLLLSAAAQLWRPRHNVAIAFLGIATMVLYSSMNVVSGTFDPLELLGLALFAAIVWLHPGAQRATGRPHGGTRTAAIVLGLAAGAFAVFNGTRQATGAVDLHSVLGHYGAMAAVALSLTVAAVLGSTRLPGWRFTAAIAAVGFTILGISWAAFPDSSSSLGFIGGIPTVLAGLGFGFSAIRRASTERA